MTLPSVIKWCSILLLVIPISVHSQQHVAYCSVTDHVRIGYDAGKSHEQVPIMSIFRELAKDQLKEPENIHIYLNGTLYISYEHVNMSLKILTFHFQCGLPEGDIHYRQFTLAKELIPSGVIIPFTWWSKGDSLRTAVKQSRAAVQDDRGIFVIRIPVLDFDPQADTLVTGDPIYLYDDTCLERFSLKTALVNDYYAATALMDSLEKLISHITLDDPAFLPSDMIYVEEINRVVRLLTSRNFGERLLYDGFDPESFSSRLKDLHRFSMSIRFNYEDLLNTQKVIPFSGNIDSICGLFVNRLLFYIRMSQLMDQIHGDIYKDYLDSCFTGNVFDDDLKILQRLLIRMYQESRQDTLVSFFSRRLLSVFLQRSQSLLSLNQYAEAWSLMACARAFTDQNPIKTTGTGADEVMSQAAKGIYQSYLGIAESSLEKKKWNMTEEYLKKAEQYRLDHAGYLAIDARYMHLNRSLLIDQLAGCDSLLRAEKFNESYRCLEMMEQKGDVKIRKFLGKDIGDRKKAARTGMLEEAVSLSESLFRDGALEDAFRQYILAKELFKESFPDEALRNRLDSLQEKASRYLVRLWYETGESFFMQRRYTEALVCFDSSITIARMSGISVDPMLDTLYRQTIKQQLISDLSSSQKAIWDKRYGNAEDISWEIEKRAAQYDLSGDADIRSAIGPFSRRVDEQTCRVVTDSFHIRMIRAEKVFAAGNYRKGVSLLKETVRLVEEYPSCKLNTLLIRDSIRRYEQAALYQQTLDEADREVVTGNYHKAVQKLADMEKQYRQYRLERFGIKEVTVYGYVKMRTNPMLTERAAGFYYNRSEPVEAFRYLSLLKEQGVPPKNLTALQQQLGKQMAIADRSTRQRPDPQELLRGYTRKDSWYRSFSEAYLDTWKQLQDK